MPLVEKDAAASTGTGPKNEARTSGTGAIADVLDDPIRFGVGARITVAVMSDDYVRIILQALSKVDNSDLVPDTGDVSTYVRGSERRLLQYLTDLSEQIALSEHHASVTIHLFRGCPGTIVCDAPHGPGPRAVDSPSGRSTGRYVSAEWALYPLADLSDGSGSADHMRSIYEAIEVTVQNGTFVKSEGSVTRLEGDLGDVLQGVVAGWCIVGRSIQHVASHLTISINSPQHQGRRSSPTPLTPLHAMSPGTHPQ